MRYSHLFGKTSKTAPADADSSNAKLLTQGGFIAKQMAGVYNFLPLGLRVLRNIQTIIREELDAAGAQEVLMPALTSEESYKITGRDTMDVLFHLEMEGGKAVLNPTHEEVVTPLVQAHTFSYRDLPLAVYQIQNKFRNEPRAKSGLLRGREFNMKDLYSFHVSQEDLDSYYDKMVQVYFKIYERLGLKEVTVLTFASGGPFSRYSHEFQALCAAGEDTIYLCNKCRQAINKEIIDEQKSCPNCMNVDLSEQRAIEVGNIFKLGTRYSDAFKFTFQTDTGETKPVIMGCYGIGPSRLMGTIVELFHDDKGIMWPETVAPFKVHLVALGGDPMAFHKAEELYNQLTAAGVSVLYDDRGDKSAGEKLGDADLLGMPWRIVVSKKTIVEEKVEVKQRRSKDAQLVSAAEAIALVS
jgi:prolyl-tRNA synthetase